MVQQQNVLQQWNDEQWKNGVGLQGLITGAANHGVATSTYMMANQVGN